MRVDQQGRVLREVALAQIALPLPDHPGQELEVRVALIRDLRRLVPKEPSPEEEDRPLQCDKEHIGTDEYWLEENWQATPSPAQPTVPKLIPIVTTATEVARKREALQKRLDKVQRWANAARKRMYNASKLYVKRCKPDL